MATRKNIYIPDELEARLERVKHEITVPLSRICADAIEAEVARIEAEIKKRRSAEATVAAVSDANNDPSFKTVTDVYEYALQKHGQHLAGMPDYEAESWLNGYVYTAGTISPWRRQS